MNNLNDISTVEVTSYLVGVNSTDLTSESFCFTMTECSPCVFFTTTILSSLKLYCFIFFLFNVVVVVVVVDIVVVNEWSDGRFSVHYIASGSDLHSSDELRTLCHVCTVASTRRPWSCPSMSGMCGLLCVVCVYNGPLTDIWSGMRPLSWLDCTLA